MKKPIKFNLRYEDIKPVWLASQRNLLLWGELKRRILWVLAKAHAYFKVNKRLLTGAFVYLKDHRPKHLQITIKFTWTRLIILGFLGFSLWPHSAQTIAAPQPYIHKIARIKPYKAVKYSVPKIKHQKYIAPLKPAYVAPAPVSSVVSGCGDNKYAQFIYQHESGCNLNAVNAGGCRGIGQACPGSKLPCGADYTCQNAFFTSYANKYGGWAGAYNFWLAHNWW